MFQKLMIGGGTAGAGLFSLFLASESDDPTNEWIASTAAATNAQLSYRLGKSVGSLWKGGHVARLGLGLGMAVPAMLGTYFGVKSLSDLGSNESLIVDAVKGLASKEAFHFTPDTKITATMRQRAMQKLSASAMNSRGQLLGNEAMILRGAPVS